ncbi:MAG: hypothetical protein ACR2KJ_07700 [Jatrophihabitans sp.]
MDSSCSTSTEPCPQCGDADLAPYGNGSKWLCPKCYFLMPCCEGGELSMARAPLPADTSRSR